MANKRTDKIIALGAAITHHEMEAGRLRTELDALLATEDTAPRAGAKKKKAPAKKKRGGKRVRHTPEELEALILTRLKDGPETQTVMVTEFRTSAPKLQEVLASLKKQKIVRQAPYRKTFPSGRTKQVDCWMLVDHARRTNGKSARSNGVHA